MSRPRTPAFPCREPDPNARCFCGKRLQMTETGSRCAGCGLSATDCLNAGRCGRDVDSADREGWRLTGYRRECAALHGS